MSDKLSKSTVSHIKAWHSVKNNRNCFNVHITSLNVMLSVYEDKQPKSYTRIKEWIESDEPELNPILFSEDETIY
ncbi:hypothetical protein [Priestia megaterium]|uniref:hypothetical protein n=1 Tax=Priestia megaterium TaxID=1404 RepID=UPI00345ADC6A